MKKFLTYKGAVMTWECDSNGHMNVMYYINKFENAGRNLSLEMGVSKIMSKEIGFVVVEQTIKYLREVFEDDLLFVESSLVNFSNKAMVMRHEMFNGITKELVSTMDVVGVLFNKTNRKAIPIPKDRIDILKKMIG
ncbi:MAG: thioesterase family protein [Saprospiraceae bacterium]|nr:acyl-CoA thioesterase [bacterium]MDC3219562.1 acyl-CoA thioesterase [Saprospiraceae bacterium]MDG1434186.1 thioesterase family protein [Saprospiraceae bacterium]MDG2419056.1 thioesterase family protein [Saprospiraceae bacterium]